MVVDRVWRRRYSKVDASRGRQRRNFLQHGGFFGMDGGRGGLEAVGFVPSPVPRREQATVLVQATEGGSLVRKKPVAAERNARTRLAIRRPGQAAIHQASARASRPEAMMLPSDTAGGGEPSPRSERADSRRRVSAKRREVFTARTGAIWGSRCRRAVRQGGEPRACAAAARSLRRRASVSARQIRASPVQVVAPRTRTRRSVEGGKSDAQH